MADDNLLQAGTIPAPARKDAEPGQYEYGATPHGEIVS